MKCNTFGPLLWAQVSQWSPKGGTKYALAVGVVSDAKIPSVPLQISFQKSGLSDFYGCWSAAKENRVRSSSRPFFVCAMEDAFSDDWTTLESLLLVSIVSQTSTAINWATISKQLRSNPLFDASRDPTLFGLKARYDNVIL
jgi:hypothetical protein